MNPTTGDMVDLVRKPADDEQPGVADFEFFCDISPRGLEILESLNTVFDTLGIEEK